MAPDTMTIDSSTVTVIWRGSVSLADVAAADLRRLTLKEAA